MIVATRVNPFPGLPPYEFGDRDHPFFGREEQTDALLERLGHGRFLAVVGTSGCGKSSLVKAGLLPALYGGQMAGVGSRWRVARMQPQLNPIGNLARALVDPIALGQEGFDRDLQREFVRSGLLRTSRGLIETVQEAQLEDGVKVLVLVDQFEELFRFKQTRTIGGAADEAAAFVKLLLEASSSLDVQVYVVITMRSDFLGDCAQFRDLPERINDGMYLVPRMTRDQLQRAIEGPVRAAGGHIDPLLVTRLLNDVGDDPDQLPVLQHALMRTWDWAADPAHAPGDPLTVRHYEAIGTMQTALSLHADDTLDGLRDDGLKRIAERLFRCLTDGRTDPRGIRRATRFADACAITGASDADLTKVVEAFNKRGRAFVMPPAGTPLADALLDISHESLMRKWDRLKGWIVAETEAAIIYDRLVTDAHAPDRWRELWREERLATGLAWLRENKDTINAAWAARYDRDLPDA